MRRPFVILVLVMASVGWLWSHSEDALATCCQTDADCPLGFACGGGACGPAVSCTCDSDCGPNLVCLPYVATVCTQKAGSTTQDCHPQSQCVTTWKRPCGTTADCGPGGFTCVANGRLCSGSDCQITSTCMAPTLPATCATDSDCPPAWTCESDTAQETACIPQAPHGCPSNGCPATVLTGAKSCVPPLFDLVGLGGFDGPPVVLPDSCPAKSDGGLGSGQQQAAATGATGGGCQIAPGGGADAMLLLGFLGLLGVILRR